MAEEETEKQSPDPEEATGAGEVTGEAAGAVTGEAAEGKKPADNDGDGIPQSGPSGPSGQSGQSGQSGENEAEAGIDGLLQEIERLKIQVQENIDKALRATAELDNVRKRTSRDIENAHKYALDKFVTGLLPVIDSMELGMNASESVDDIESLREGMDLTLKKFFDCLEKFGVTAIDPNGEKFNPERHEAVSMQEMEGMETNTIITVMQKGYALNGRLVRPAMVVVAK